MDTLNTRPIPGVVPFRIGRELLYAFAMPVVLIAAAVTLFWNIRYAPGALPDWATPVSAVTAAAATLALVATGFLGRYRRADSRGRFTLLILTGFGAWMVCLPLDSAMLAERGVEVQCTVESTYEKQYRRSTIIEHVLDCPGWSSPTMGTDPGDRLAVGSPVTAFIDPEGTIPAQYGEVDGGSGYLWTGGIALATLALAGVRLVIARTVR
ncbi:hypothetical protein [Glycomyces dulcitolivorans]|uniref:hypothetical protein n=1 Tax=Glycomyces dulcitolivorans TaxID=2200759 RepID=UPI000DD3CD78|nr:hypothetical protein [Glycomyces dulcitolivorans]